MSSPNDQLHKALMKVLDEATFELKAREVASFSKVYVWVRDEVPKLWQKKEEPEEKPKPPTRKKKKG